MHVAWSPSSLGVDDNFAAICNGSTCTHAFSSLNILAVVFLDLCDNLGKLNVAMTFTSSSRQVHPFFQIKKNKKKKKTRPRLGVPLACERWGSTAAKRIGARADEKRAIRGLAYVPSSRAAKPRLPRVRNIVGHGLVLCWSRPAARGAGKLPDVDEAKRSAPTATRADSAGSS